MNGSLRRISSAPFARRLVIMAREPVAGRVKSRLARRVGTVEATRFYRQVSRALIGRLAADPRWLTWLAVSPDCSCDRRAWPAHVVRRGQGHGDLADRMQRIMDWPVRGPIVIVGTDIPAIQPAQIAAAFRALGRHDAVLGPAADGGYWLIGLRRRPRVPLAFGNVRWSGPHAMADTLDNLAGLSVAQVACLSDVDQAEDLAGAAGWFGRRILPVGRAER